jgi:hypothetical protein
VRTRGYSVGWAYARAYVHVALIIQHATRMGHIVRSFVAPRLHHIFQRCLLTVRFFGKNIEHEMCVNLLYKLYINDFFF